MTQKREAGLADAEVPAARAVPREQAMIRMEDKERFSFVLQNTSDIITVFDKAGRIIFQSPSIGRILGIDPRARIGANIFDSALVHPGDRARKRRFVKQLIAAKSGEEVKGDFRLRHVDGSYRDIEAVGINFLHDPALHGVILSSRDVTKRRSAERALAESEAKYALTFNNAPIGIAHNEPVDGRFVLVNQHLCDILGYSQKELLRKRFKDVTNDEDLRRDLRAVEDLESGKISTYHHEQRCYRKDGSAVCVNLRMAPQRDADGKVAYFLITIEDITERKRAETAAKLQHELEAKAAVLTEQREQLIVIGKTKDEFISIASHQLRTPASSVKQYVGMLLAGYLGEITPEQRDFLAKAYDSNERQLEIIKQLLYVARLDAGKVRLQSAACNLSKLVAEIVDEHRLQFDERQQKIILDKPPKSIVIPADERLLRMAVDNLVDNAGKYSPAGKSIAVNLRRNGQWAEITVRDHGVGISKKDQADLFQKFFRVDNPLSVSAGGTGLGLYWAKKIIDLHHGSLEVDSRLRYGSTFTIKLPTSGSKTPE